MTVNISSIAYLLSFVRRELFFTNFVDDFLFASSCERIDSYLELKYKLFVQLETRMPALCNHTFSTQSFLFLRIFPAVASLARNAALNGFQVAVDESNLPRGNALSVAPICGSR